MPKNKRAKRDKTTEPEDHSKQKELKQAKIADVSKGSKVQQARVSDADDDSGPGSPISDDNWPPGWSEKQKRDTDPVKWPLTKDQMSKLKILMQKLGKVKKPTPGKIAKLIGDAEVWDVSHPKWKLEGRKGIGYHFHPDKIRRQIEESRNCGLMVNDDDEEELLNLATVTFQSGSPVRNMLRSITDIAQTAMTRLMGRRRPHYRISAGLRRRFLGRTTLGNLQ